MTFREKAKHLFRRSRGDSLTKSSTKDSNSSKERWPSNVYKPGEPMPKPKYRAPPKKEHKEHLEAFSFADAWRRKSFQSQYSPMGTRLPSRRNSWMSTRRKSYRSQRSNSVASDGTEKTEKSGVTQKEHHGAAKATRLSTEIEAEGDDDVGNVGMSRVQSRERYPISRPRSVDSDLVGPHDSIGPLDGQVNGELKDQPNSYAYEHPTGSLPPSTAHDHQPFSEDELALALKRSHLAVPAQG